MGTVNNYYPSFISNPLKSNSETKKISELFNYNLSKDYTINGTTVTFNMNNGIITINKPIKLTHWLIESTDFQGAYGTTTPLTFKASDDNIPFS